MVLGFVWCSPPVFSGVRYTRSLVLYVCFVDRCLSFCTFFLLAIVLSVLLRYTDSDCPFGIFKLFLMPLSTIYQLYRGITRSTRIKPLAFSFHFKYFIDKSIGLDNRLCLYKSSPTTRRNN
jgi:hypothetical protein